MKMKPIYFPSPVADDMIRAILADRKTVTRRVVKPQPAGDGSRPEPLITRPGYWNTWGDDFVYRQPYRTGDILYVRETFSDELGKLVYKADGAKLHDGMCWHPSIHMPREAARIFLRVTDVRVERLNNISDDDISRDFGFPKEAIPSMSREQIDVACMALWDSTIKPADRALYGWGVNPFVWVIAFERCERPTE